MPHSIHHGPPLPRELIFYASLWLVGSWMVAIGVQPPLQPSASSYTPGVRTMLLCVMLGLVIAWPLLRLSQPATQWPVQRTLLDLTSLVALTQVIVWPIRLVTTWGLDRTLAIALVIVGWTAIVGAVVTVATGTGRSGPLARGVAMAACCALCVLGPGVAWLLAAWATTSGSGFVWDGGIALWMGPLVGVHTLTGGGITAITTDEWHAILLLLGAALAAWIAAPLTFLVRTPPVELATPSGTIGNDGDGDRRRP